MSKSIQNELVIKMINCPIVSWFGGVIAVALIGVFLSWKFNSLLFNRPKLIIKELSFRLEENWTRIDIDLFNEGRDAIRGYYYFMFDRNVYSNKDKIPENIRGWSAPNNASNWGEQFNKEESQSIKDKVKFAIVYNNFNNNWFYSEGLIMKGKFKQGKQARLIMPIINWKAGKYKKIIIN